MSETNGKARHRYLSPAEPPATQVTPQVLYQAAVLQGVMSNPDILHDLEKTTSLAERYADRMCQRDADRDR